MPPISEEPNVVIEEEASPNASNKEILHEPRQRYISSSRQLTHGYIHRYKN